MYSCETPAAAMKIFIITVITKPHTAEVSGDNDHNILRQFDLLRELFQLKSLEISVGIAGNINHTNFLLLGWSMICSISAPFRNVTLMRLSVKTVTFSSS